MHCMILKLFKVPEIGIQLVEHEITTYCLPTCGENNNGFSVLSNPQCLILT